MDALEIIDKQIEKANQDKAKLDDLMKALKLVKSGLEKELKKEHEKL